MNHQPPPVSRVGWDDQKIMRTRRELDSVKAIMKENVQKIMERQGKLDDLVERAQRLEEASDVYVKCAVKIKREMSWKANSLRYGIIAVSSVSAFAGLAYSFL
ncbi:V-SNARE coiled-coil homology domain-containing protein [Caenorhabditis elegans]|uniref:V-SNARE coiled-coil homology domain-containing protein n=1 Tax=Caenorhabditis elegans TaxID=6239 RepID=G5EBK2_CAEEL|nr:V-SNARE coiled-coil homology domain-containing protein [Caenorhabditis elegans]CAE18062.1 V-SNARE coiled-coil homology domain-containing protein [Caenorhabditis elegans]|eukprot:NP_001023622.1 SyNaptoBrevin related [Caenorhabditis elegans]